MVESGAGGGRASQRQAQAETILCALEISEQSKAR